MLRLIISGRIETLALFMNTSWHSTTTTFKDKEREPKFAIRRIFSAQLIYGYVFLR